MFQKGQQKPGLLTISEDMVDEWESFKVGVRVDELGFYSCYKTGETIWLRE